MFPISPVCGDVIVPQNIMQNGVSNADVYLFVSWFVAYDGPLGNVLSYASPCQVGPYSINQRVQFGEVAFNL
jgi:hypothetical protein